MQQALDRHHNVVYFGLRTVPRYLRREEARRVQVPNARCWDRDPHEK